MAGKSSCLFPYEIPQICPLSIVTWTLFILQIKVVSKRGWVGPGLLVKVKKAMKTRQLRTAASGRPHGNSGMDIHLLTQNTVF